MNKELKNHAIHYAFSYLHAMPTMNTVDITYLPCDMQPHFHKIDDISVNIIEDLKKYNENNIPDELFHKVVGLAINYLNMQMKSYTDEILEHNLNNEEHPYQYIRNILYAERNDLKKWWDNYQSKDTLHEITDVAVHIRSNKTSEKNKTTIAISFTIDSENIDIAITKKDKPTVIFVDSEDSFSSYMDSHEFDSILCKIISIPDDDKYENNLKQIVSQIYTKIINKKGEK